MNTTDELVATDDAPADRRSGRWIVEQVLDTETEYISVLVNDVEVARGTPEQMMHVENALRETIERITGQRDTQP